LTSVLTKSIQKELNSFFGKISDEGYPILEVTKGALTQARAKLNYTAFIDLSSDTIETFYEDCEYRTWKGFRLFAIDGSTSYLPSHPSISKEFGSSKVGSDKQTDVSLATLSLMYDVLNHITIDAKIASFKTSEQTLFTEHLECQYLQKDDLILADRGYPSIAKFYELQHKGLQFCIRMKQNWWKEVDAFSKSGN
jgi:Transposase DDE domain